MNKTELNREYKEALAKYLEPIAFALNETRRALGLAPVDITQRAGIEHEITYFKNGFFEGAAGYFDRWYEDKKAYKAYLAGNYAGREFCKGEFQAIG
jgi:hypothetical protein